MTESSTSRRGTVIGALSLLQTFVRMIVGLLLLYAVTRMTFLLVNRTFFEIDGVAASMQVFFQGIRYDLSAIAVANVLLFLLWPLPFSFLSSKVAKGVCKTLFIATNGLFLMTNLIDVAYYPFLQRRMQFDIFQYTSGKKGNEALGLLPQFISDFWYLWIVFFVLLWLLQRLFYHSTSQQKMVPQHAKNILGSALLSVSMVALSIVAFRGGLQLKPIDIINAAEVSGPKFIPLIINSPFSIYKSSDKTGVICQDGVELSATDFCENNIHLPDTTMPFERRNIVIIVVESLSEEYISSFGGASRTPFLDSLLRKSLVFRDAYANAKESIQGIPAIYSSIPSWQNDAFIFSAYSANEITSFANLLRPYGYHTSFYHGGATGTMGFDAYCKLAGIEHYYGREDYNNDKDYDGHWGIWDEPFLQYMARQLNETPEPFCATVFTLNTHHPFLLPEAHQNRFEALPGHPILQSVQYADYALMRYFETISKEKWYENTLFVITADHTGPALSNGGNFHKQYRIPIAIFDPRSVVQGEHYEMANQIDVLPTMMQLLHFPKPFISLGRNLLDSTHCQQPHFTYQYNAGIYAISDSVFTYMSDLEKDLGLFAWKTDPLFKENLSARYADKQKSLDIALRKKMLAFCRALHENGLRGRVQ